MPRHPRLVEKGQQWGLKKAVYDQSSPLRELRLSYVFRMDEFAALVQTAVEGKASSPCIQTDRYVCAARKTHSSVLDVDANATPLSSLTN